MYHRGLRIELNQVVNMSMRLNKRRGLPLAALMLAALVGLVIAGQLLSSLAIDHFALLGSAHRPVSIIKLAGALVMVTGLAISLFGDRWSRLFV